MFLRVTVLNYGRSTSSNANANATSIPDVPMLPPLKWFGQTSIDDYKDSDRPEYP